MKRRIQLSALLLLAFSFHGGLAKADVHYYFGCNILSSEFKNILKFPGRLCAFDQDGSFYRTLDGKSVEKISKLGKLIWKLAKSAHHQLKITRDRSKIYFLSDEIVKIQGKKVRTDALLLVAAKSGRVLSKWSQFAHRKEMQKFDPNFPDYFPSTSNWSKNILRIPYETMHFNSIDEIPQNLKSQKFPWLAAGNFVVNLTNVANFAVLDSKLEKTLWSKNFHGYIHDVQITASGDLLYYLNNLIETNFKKESKILLYDFVEDKTMTLYSGGEKNRFYSRDMGGVQLLKDSSLLVNENSPEQGGSFRIVDKSGNTIQSLPNSEIDTETHLPAMTQEIKQADLTEFLKNNLL